MSRSTLERPITADDIFYWTNNGLDVWEREVSNLSLTKNISSPVRSGDENPSFRVKLSSTSGIYIGVDYTSGEVFNAITLVQRLYGLNFKDAIAKIAWDFQLSDKVKSFDRVVQPKIEKVIKTEPILYEYTEMKFKKRHHAYWNCGELYEDFLNENGVYAASHIAINKKVIKIPSNEMCFVYIPKDLAYGNLKILRIGENVLPQDKWRTNIPNEYLWNFYRYEGGDQVDQLWVIKSYKDELIAKLLGLNTISVQSENKQILDKNMERILPIAKEVVINYGSDPDGVEKCKFVQEKYGTKYYNTPKSLLPEVNDLFSYSCAKSLRQLERHIKSKKLI